MSFEIDIVSHVRKCDINKDLLLRAIHEGLRQERAAAAVVSVSVVDNATIHRLNREHLQHDYATDVISFPLDWRHPERSSPPAVATQRSEGAVVEGEIVVSSDYAVEMAPRFGWPFDCELTLYAVHGLLHLCGYDDLCPEEKEIMQMRETAVLRGLGIERQVAANVKPRS